MSTFFLTFKLMKENWYKYTLYTTLLRTRHLPSSFFHENNANVNKLKITFCLTEGLKLSQKTFPRVSLTTFEYSNKRSFSLFSVLLIQIKITETVVLPKVNIEYCQKMNLFNQILIEWNFKPTTSSHNFAPALLPIPSSIN